MTCVQINDSEAQNSWFYLLLIKKSYTWRKIFAIYMANKISVSRIYKELWEINKNRKGNPSGKGANFKRHVIQDVIYIVNKHVKSCSISLSSREINAK